ncbi:hypothetical protein ARMSODRAFT_957417, partial [Armillaria solidipes]
EQRCTGTEPERKHKNHDAREHKGTQTQETRTGQGRKGLVKQGRPEKRGAHDELERPARAANLVVKESAVLHIVLVI